MARIHGGRRRQRTRAFTELQSHYLFDDRFGRPAKGNDKGKVEGMAPFQRSQVDLLARRLAESPQRLIALFGPRQTGTLI